MTTNGRSPRTVRSAATAVAVAAAAMLLGTLAACSNSAAPAAPTAPAAPKVVNMDASWAQYYRSLADLKVHTDVAAEGTITRATQEPGASTANTPFTDFQFTVTADLYDPHGHHAATSAAPRTPMTLLIHQTGGIVDGEVYQISDDPLFKVGEKYVLFLREYAPGHYMVVGGPTGRFAVSDSGTITPIVSDGVQFTGTPTTLYEALKTS